MASSSSRPKLEAEAKFSGKKTGVRSAGGESGDSAQRDDGEGRNSAADLQHPCSAEVDIFASCYIEKSWIDFMEEEAMRDESSQGPKKLVQWPSLQRSSKTKGDTDFSKVMNESKTTTCQWNALGASQEIRRAKKRPNLSDVLKEECWSKCRSINLLNQEDTRNIGDISEEDSLTNDFLYDSESTLQERKCSTPAYSPSERVRPRFSFNTPDAVAKKQRRFGPTLRPHYASPKSGWEYNEEVLKRRDVDLRKGYNSDVYKRYVAKFPKKDRIRHSHPVTPNKYIKVSRRSWDMQVRLWRRSIYAFMGESIDSDSSILSHSLSDVSISDSCDSEASSQSSTGRSECASSIECPSAPGEEDKEETLTG